MKRSLLVSSLLAVAVLAAGAAQAAGTAQTVTVTPAYSYTTVTTAPLVLGNGPDIPAGPDYPYPGAVVTTASPALITTPVLSTHYQPTPLVTFAAPAPMVATAGSTTVLGAGSSRLTTDVPSQAGEASTMTGGAPNLLTTNSHPISIVSGSPIVIYQY